MTPTVKTGLISSTDLANTLGISPKTLWEWTVKRSDLRACQARRGFYAVDRLVGAGYLREDRAPGAIDYEALAEALAPRIAALLQGGGA